MQCIALRVLSCRKDAARRGRRVRPPCRQSGAPVQRPAPRCPRAQPPAVTSVAAAAAARRSSAGSSKVQPSHGESPGVASESRRQARRQRIATVRRTPPHPPAAIRCEACEAPPPPFPRRHRHERPRRPRSRPRLGGMAGPAMAGPGPGGDRPGPQWLTTRTGSGARQSPMPGSD